MYVVTSLEYEHAKAKVNVLAAIMYVVRRAPSYHFCNHSHYGPGHFGVFALVPSIRQQKSFTFFFILGLRTLVFVLGAFIFDFGSGFCPGFESWPLVLALAVVVVLVLVLAFKVGLGLGAEVGG